MVPLILISYKQICGRSDAARPAQVILQERAWEVRCQGAQLTLGMVVCRSLFFTAKLLQGSFQRFAGVFDVLRTT